MHTESDGTYGVPRITAELREDGERVNHKRVARVMRTIGLVGLRLRKKHRTTIPDPAASSEAVIHIASIDNLTKRITDETTPTWRGTN
ncbi:MULTISPECIES: IS3 family transposase [unclassified Streptomyces]|uniref:IS3 family transposase n=1 Tax=unclassified Streptomyces TaxID=2593676 RepID=UPI003868439D